VGGADRKFTYKLTLKLFNIIIYHLYCSAQVIQDRKITIKHIQYLLILYDINVTFATVFFSQKSEERQMPSNLPPPCL
jgi:hypothetical protein